MVLRTVWWSGQQQWLSCGAMRRSQVRPFLYELAPANFVFMHASCCLRYQSERHCSALDGGTLIQGQFGSPTPGCRGMMRTALYAARTQCCTARPSRLDASFEKLITHSRMAPVSLNLEFHKFAPLPTSWAMCRFDLQDLMQERWGTGEERWKGLTWGMMPLLGGALCACTHHTWALFPTVNYTSASAR